MPRPRNGWHVASLLDSEASRDDSDPFPTQPTYSSASDLFRFPSEFSRVQMGRHWGRHRWLHRIDDSAMEEVAREEIGRALAAGHFWTPFLDAFSDEISWRKLWPIEVPVGGQSLEVDADGLLEGLENWVRENPHSPDVARLLRFSHPGLLRRAARAMAPLDKEQLKWLRRSGGDSSETLAVIDELAQAGALADDAIPVVEQMGVAGLLGRIRKPLAPRPRATSKEAGATLLRALGDGGAPLSFEAARALEREVHRHETAGREPGRHTLVAYARSSDSVSDVLERFEALAPHLSTSSLVQTATAILERPDLSPSAALRVFEQTKVIDGNPGRSYANTLLADHPELRRAVLEGAGPRDRLRLVEAAPDSEEARGVMDRVFRDAAHDEGVIPGFSESPATRPAHELEWLATHARGDDEVHRTLELVEAEDPRARGPLLRIVQPLIERSGASAKAQADVIRFGARNLHGSDLKALVRVALGDASLASHPEVRRSVLEGFSSDLPRDLALRLLEDPLGDELPELVSALETSDPQSLSEVVQGWREEVLERIPRAVLARHLLSSSAASVREAAWARLPDCSHAPDVDPSIPDTQSPEPERAAPAHPSSPSSPTTASPRASRGAR